MLALMSNASPPPEDAPRALLRRLLLEKGVSFKAASEQVGKNQTYIQQYLEKGSPRTLPEDVRLALAKLLEVPQQTLRTGDLAGAKPSIIPLGRRAADPVLHPGEWPRDVPVLGAAAAGADGRFDFNGQTVDHVRRPPRLAGVRDAYALYVLGESMKPWRENGALIYVHPHLPPNIGDYVVVQIHAAEGEPPSGYVKQLVRRTPAELRLHQFNEARDIIIPARKVVSIHRVIDWSELLGL